MSKSFVWNWLWRNVLSHWIPGESSLVITKLSKYTTNRWHHSQIVWKGQNDLTCSSSFQSFQSPYWIYQTNLVVFALIHIRIYKGDIPFHSPLGQQILLEDHHEERGGIYSLLGLLVVLCFLVSKNTLDRKGINYWPYLIGWEFVYPWTFPQYITTRKVIPLHSTLLFGHWSTREQTKEFAFVWEIIGVFGNDTWTSNFRIRD